MALILNVDVWYQLEGGRRVKRIRGDEINPDTDMQRDWLVNCGIAVELPEGVGESTTEGKPEKEHVTPDEGSGEAETQEVEQESEEAPRVQTASRRPAKNRDEKTWAKYAKDLGLDPTGMNKGQIMRLVEDYEASKAE